MPYISVACDESGEILNPDYSSLERWAMDSDLAVEMNQAGFVEAGDSGIYAGPDDRFAKIVEVEE